MDKGRSSLRERKKSRTRTAIQAHALRLFREQGYAATSIEQIAEAAEVSPSTVFRYFPTKPDLVLYDDLDERLIQEYRDQPPHLTAVQALCAVYRSAFAPSNLEYALQREQLIRSVPELRAAMLDELARTVREIANLVAERSGRSPEDSQVLAVSGAAVGIGIAAWLTSEGDNWIERFQDRLDTGMALLESIRL